MTVKMLPNPGYGGPTRASLQEVAPPGETNRNAPPRPSLHYATGSVADHTPSTAEKSCVANKPGQQRASTQPHARMGVRGTHPCAWQRWIPRRRSTLPCIGTGSSGYVSDSGLTLQLRRWREHGGDVNRGAVYCRCGAGNSTLKSRGTTRAVLRSHHVSVPYGSEQLNR